MKLRTGIYGPLLAGVLLALGGCVASTTQPATPLAAATEPAVSDGFIHARMLIIVRHGDIDIASKKTLGAQAPLIPRGEQRAAELAYALKDSGITRIVTSETLRTQETAQVLAKELHLDLDSPFGHGGQKLSAEANLAAKKNEAINVVKYLAETSKPGEVILLVHHHSVIPGILKQLGYTEPPIIEDSEFDRLYVVIPNPSDHTYKVLRLRYGGDWGPDSPGHAN